MMVPIHLLYPPEGGWPIQEAARLWMWLKWDISPTAPETTEFQRIRAQAHRDMREIASQAPGGANVPKPVTVRRRLSTWDLERDMERGRVLVRTSPSPPQANWVSQPALATLAVKHGIPYPQLPKAPGDEGNVGADEQQPTSPTGRPSTNAEAYAFIDSLMADGSPPKDAYLEAATRFPGSARDLAQRAEQLGAGYRQYKNQRKGANKSP